MLAAKDRYFLDNFKNNLGTTYSIIDINSHGYPASRIIITSKKICDDLYNNFNITPNKSLTYNPPILDNTFLDCFIMGLIDGDGSIGFQKRKYSKDSLYISIVGTKETCLLVKDKFEKIINKETSNIFQRNKEKNFYSYRVSDRNARKIFMYFFKQYHDILPTLKRKWSNEIYEYCTSWKKSSCPSRQKGVNVFNLQGELIKTFNTLKEASEFTGALPSAISMICKENNNKHQAKGFMFNRGSSKNILPYNKELDKGETNIEDNQ